MTIYRKDLVEPNYSVKQVNLIMDLDQNNTIVRSNIDFHKDNLKVSDLVLDFANKDIFNLDEDAQFLTLESISIDGVELSSEGDKPGYKIDKEQGLITIFNVPEKFNFEAVTRINPSKNTMGLGIYIPKEENISIISQCESHGFRNITPFLDRPDVRATYNVKLIADPKNFPTLLANGEKVKQVQRADGKIEATYFDDYPKASYLFAINASKMGCLSKKFTTKSGKVVSAEVYLDQEDLSKGITGLNAIPEYLKWMEDNYGFEYERGSYRICVAKSFNSGAMENPGLNYFCEKFIYTDPRTTTDDEFAMVYDVIAHEGAHDNFGNIVGNKSWFDLSIKEGLASAIENQFYQDLLKSPVARMDKIHEMIAYGYSADSGPNAHPVRCESFESEGDIYDSITYTKGAEILKVFETIYGREMYVKCMQAYRDFFKGKVADIDDMLNIFAKVTGEDMTIFSRWYSQEGIPLLKFNSEYNEETKEYKLIVEQSCPDTATQKSDEKLPFHIPIGFALIDKEGNEVPLVISSDSKSIGTNTILNLKEKNAVYTFNNVPSGCVPSLMRGYSAPAKIIDSPLTIDDKYHLLKFDKDPINQWLTSTSIYMEEVKRLVNDASSDKEVKVSDTLIAVMGSILNNKDIQPDVKVKILSLPLDAQFYEMFKPADPELISDTKSLIEQTFAITFKDDLVRLYNEFKDKTEGKDYFSPELKILREFRNFCLNKISNVASKELLEEIVVNQYRTSNYMTNVRPAINSIIKTGNINAIGFKQTLIDEHFARYDSIFDNPSKNSFIAALNLANTTDINYFKNILNNPWFKNDDTAVYYSVIGGFKSNSKAYHQKSGEGYKFIIEILVDLDKRNPAVASTLMGRISNLGNILPELKKLFLENLMAQDFGSMSESLQGNVKKSVTFICKDLQIEVPEFKVKPLKDEKSTLSLDFITSGKSSLEDVLSEKPKTFTPRLDSIKEGSSLDGDKVVKPSLTLNVEEVEKVTDLHDSEEPVVKQKVS